MPTRVLRRAPRAAALSSSDVRRLGDTMLASLDLEHAELSVLLTDDRRIQALNRDHRGKDRPTDVLAFPQEDEPVAVGVPELLGDVVISLDTAERQARSRGRPLLSEVRFLLAHGVLHLIGFDHDTPAKKKVMTAETRRLVRACEKAAPAPRSGQNRPQKKKPRGRIRKK